MIHLVERRPCEYCPAGVCRLYGGPPDAEQCWADGRYTMGNDRMACGRPSASPLGLCFDHYQSLVPALDKRDRVGTLSLA